MKSPQYQNTRRNDETSDSVAVYDSDSTTTVNSSYIAGECRRQSEEDQNLANREHEKMYKQCKDGFCYCFTSDSDGVRKINLERKRSRRKVHHSLPQKLTIAEKNERNNCIKAISTLEEDLNSDGPMIHIIQQIHNNCVISEVRVNKNHLPARCPVAIPRKSRKSCPAAVIEEVTEEETRSEETQVSETSEITPKKNYEKAGKLLEKRLSYSAGQKEKPKKAYQTDVFSTLPKGTPPPKPPRSSRASRSLYSNSNSSDSSQTSSLRNAEKLLDNFLKSNGYTIPKYPPKPGRKSLPSTNLKADKVYPTPSCPNLSDIDEVKDHELGWTTKGISDMLNYEKYEKSTAKVFDTNHCSAEPQMGWKVPAQKEIPIGWNAPKELARLRIDTVDGADMNFAENHNPKETPMKIEPQTKPELASSPKILNYSNFKQKAKKNTKNFLNISGKKLKKLVCTKQQKKFDTPPTTRTIGSQTDSSKDMFSVQSPPGSYSSNSPKVVQSQEKFNFHRTVKPPPKPTKCFSRQLNFQQQTQTEPQKSYKSYNIDLDQDLTIHRMNGILGSIKSKLEASDEHAIKTFRESEIIQEVLNNSRRNEEEDDVDYSTMFVSASADVHNKDGLHSEIEEESMFVTGAPSMSNLRSSIPHFFAGNDPTAVYASVLKPAKSRSYNNLMEKHSPPKNRHLSKSDLSLGGFGEAFLENFKKSREDVEAQNREFWQKIENLDLNQGFSAPLASTETFPMDAKSDTESQDTRYESPNVTFNQMHMQHINMEQSTPKKRVYLSKEEEEVGYDTVDGTVAYVSIDESLNKLHSVSGPLPGNTSVLKYKHFKNKIRESFKKGSTYWKSGSKRLSFIGSPAKEPSYNLHVSLNELHELEHQTNVKEQLEKAVNICRKTPELECTLEMAEAERLLLFSTLKSGVARNESFSIKASSLHSSVKNCTIEISGIEISIQLSQYLDDFFNYYYTGVFSNGKVIKSTESSWPKQENLLIFRDVGILFDNLDPESVITCDIYMLKLRKILNTSSLDKKTLSLKKKAKEMNSSIQEPSDGGIASRFKIHGSLKLTPIQFIPFRLSPQKLKNKITISSENNILVPINHIPKNTNLEGFAKLTGHCELHFNEFPLEGFLNVQDVDKKHNWNRRWCKVKNVSLNIWNYPQDEVLESEPIFTINLSTCLPSEVKLRDSAACNRPRSFQLKYPAEGCDEWTVVYFSAENITDFELWTNGFWKIFDFLNKWKISAIY
ncbi:hypothetical protein ACFFRR_000652 [Megaselia abdita]